MQQRQQQQHQQSPRVQSLRQEIAERLKSVCSEWPNESFQQMVDRLAEITVRYEQDSRKRAPSVGDPEPH